MFCSTAQQHGSSSSYHSELHSVLYYSTLGAVLVEMCEAAPRLAETHAVAMFTPWQTPQERVEEGEIDPHTPLFINIAYTKKDPHSGKIAGAQKGG